MKLRVRLSFPRGEHRDVLLDSQGSTIGSATDNQIVLTSSDVLAHHAQVAVDGRGITLRVLDPCARVHLNARPVRERAILRLGDTLNIGSVQISVKPERDETICTIIPARAKSATDYEAPSRLVPSKVVLRGLSGSHFGRVIPVHAHLTIGRGSECDLTLDESEMSRRHASIENSEEGVFLRDFGSASGTCINGVQVKDAVLHPGDQIAFDRNRFLLEAPGLPLRGELSTYRAAKPTITQTVQVVDAPNPKNLAMVVNGSRTEIWWLIGAAALIGAAIALLLLARF